MNWTSYLRQYSDVYAAANELRRHFVQHFNGDWERQFVHGKYRLGTFEIEVQLFPTRTGGGQTVQDGIYFDKILNMLERSPEWACVDEWQLHVDYFFTLPKSFQEEDEELEKEVPNETEEALVRTRVTFGTKIKIEHIRKHHLYSREYHHQGFLFQTDECQETKEDRQDKNTFQQRTLSVCNRMKESGVSQVTVDKFVKDCLLAQKTRNGEEKKEKDIWGY